MYAAAISRSNQLLALVGRSDALRRLEPFMAQARHRVVSAVGHKDVAQTLGFDPLAVLRALLRR